MSPALESSAVEDGQDRSASGGADRLVSRSTESYKQWSLNSKTAGANVFETWDRGNRGQGMVVAVIDSGLDVTVPDLQDRIAPGGYNFVKKSDTDFTGQNLQATNHGTANAAMLAGIAAVAVVMTAVVATPAAAGWSDIAGRSDGTGITGVAPDSRVLPLIATSRGDVVDAINKAIDLEVDVISTSVDGATDGPSDKEREAIRRAEEAGIPIITSAGNGAENGSNIDIDQHPVFPSSYSRQHDNIIPVTSLNRSDDLHTPTNYGANTVVVAAPGGDVIAPRMNDRGAWEYSGTSGSSVAAPHVAATAALMLQAIPTLSPKNVRDAIIESANKSSASLAGTSRSEGFIDVDRAVATAADYTMDTDLVTLRTSGDLTQSITLDDHGFMTREDSEESSYQKFIVSKGGKYSFIRTESTNEYLTFDPESRQVKLSQNAGGSEVAYWYLRTMGKDAFYQVHLSPRSYPDIGIGFNGTSKNVTSVALKDSAPFELIPAEHVAGVHELIGADGRAISFSDLELVMGASVACR